MDKVITDERLMEVATLVMEAVHLFEGLRIPHSISMEIGWYPEIVIQENIGSVNSKWKRYKAYRLFEEEKYDPTFERAEMHIRRLMEEAAKDA
jgi:hypothetical protein